MHSGVDIDGHCSKHGTGPPTDATTTSAFSNGETEARADRSKVRWI